MYQANQISSVGTSQSNPVAHVQMDLGAGAMVPHNGGNNNPNMAARQRLRWTNELHERFVEAVTQLGGPDSMYWLLYLVFPFSLCLWYVLLCRIYIIIFKGFLVGIF
jgi:hypothetical protein